MSKLNQLMEKAPDHILRKFARKCALRHVEKIKPYCSEKEYELIVKWLETGDESIRLAARSANSAAISVAYSAANSAAYWAADSAAYSVARSARSAAYSAYSAVYSAAGSAAKAQEREWQEQTLLEMMGVVMTNQEILKNGKAAEGWTHYVLENGTNYYFKVYQLNAEIWTEDGWLEYETTCALPDLEGVRSRKDIERIVELEQEIESYKQAQEKRDLEQRAQGVEDLKSWLQGHLSEVDLPDTAVMYIEEYAERLRKQAKELDQ